MLSDNQLEFNWKELLAQRDEQERQERERLLQKGREAWAKIKQEVKKHNGET